MTGPAAALLSAVLLTACLSGVEPDVGDPQRERCVNVDSDPGTDVSFSRDVAIGIFLRDAEDGAPGCRCHDPASATPIGLEIGGLDLSTYGAVRRGGNNSGSGIVVAGNPCDSVLVQKIGDGAPFGARMPFNGPPHLAPADQQLIRDWIAEGALEN